MDLTNQEQAIARLLIACIRGAGDVLFEYDRIGRDAQVFVYPRGVDGRDMSAIALNAPDALDQLKQTRRIIASRPEGQS